MKTTISAKHESTETLSLKEIQNNTLKNIEIADAYAEFERGVYASLETYSNVHRGSGHNSAVTTHLYEQARDIVLEYLGLDKGKYIVIFCTPRRATILKALLDPKNYQCISSQDAGLSIGIRALAIRKKTLPRGIPFQTGGGTAKLMSKSWVIWADAPDRFEAGTPAIVNIIAFAKSLRIMQQYGNDIFKGSTYEELSATQILYTDELEKYSGKELLDQLRKTLIGRGIQVPTMEGSKPFINLDNSASTPTFNPVWNTFRQTLYQPLQVQKETVQEVRTICADILGAPPTDYEVIFTANTTEAINLASENLRTETTEGSETVVINTLLEHSSNELPWRTMPGISLIRLPVNTEGFFDLNELETLLRNYNQKLEHGKKRIKLVAISGASNVLGVCNNIEAISKIVHAYGASLLVDAAQLLAHRKIDMEKCNIDYLAFSGHKVYAPFGCGALVARKGLLHFNAAEMELIHSSGEENSGGIAALGKALVLLKRIGMNAVHQEEQALTGRALRGMAKIHGLKLYGITDPESPDFASKVGVIAFNLENMMSNKVANELALRSGIGIRYGCHCAHIIVKHLLNIPPFLEKFQRLIVTLFPKLRLPGVARVSLGIENTEEEVDKLIQVLSKIAPHKPSSEDNPVIIENKKTYILTMTETQKQMNDFVSASALKVYS